MTESSVSSSLWPRYGAEHFKHPAPHEFHPLLGWFSFTDVSVFLTAPCDLSGFVKRWPPWFYSRDNQHLLTVGAVYRHHAWAFAFHSTIPLIFGVGGDPGRTGAVSY